MSDLPEVGDMFSCGTCSKLPCVCVTPPAPHALTREQLQEWMYRHQNAAIDRERYRTTSNTLDRQFAYDAELQRLELQLLDHDSALRQALAQQAQELIYWKQQAAHFTQRCAEQGDSIAEDRRLLDQQAQEVERLNNDVGMLRDEPARLKQQLAAMTAEVRRLQEELKRYKHD